MTRSRYCDGGGTFSLWARRPVDPLGRAGAGGDLPDERAVVLGDCAQCVGVRELGHQPAGRFCVRYAWPSARWGALPLEGGVEAAYRAEIDAAPDPVAKMAAIDARLEALRSPFRTAEAFWVEEIIDPRETRRLLCEFSGLAAPLRTVGCGRLG